MYLSLKLNNISINAKYIVLSLLQTSSPHPHCQRLRRLPIPVQQKPTPTSLMVVETNAVHYRLHHLWRGRLPQKPLTIPSSRNRYWNAADVEKVLCWGTDRRGNHWTWKEKRLKSVPITSARIHELSERETHIKGGNRPNRIRETPEPWKSYSRLVHVPRFHKILQLLQCG